jgi:predicted Zn-dependent peptidase
LDPRGSTISLAALDRRRLLDHYRREYPLGSLTLLVAGDVDAEQLLSQLGRWFGDKRDQGPVLLANTLPAMPPAPVAGEPTVAAPVEIFRTTDRDECHVFLGARAPARRDPDAAAAQVLWEVLAGAQGRLRRSLAELAPLASFRVVWFGALEGGAMGIDLVAPRDKLPDVVATLRAEIAHFLTEGADPRDVARARTWLVGRRSLGLEDRGQVFTAMARDEAFGLGLEAYRSLVDRLTTVEAADVSRVARALLPAEKLILTVVQPSEGKPRSP